MLSPLSKLLIFLNEIVKKQRPWPLEILRKIVLFFQNMLMNMIFSDFKHLRQHSLETHPIPNQDIDLQGYDATGLISKGSSIHLIPFNIKGVLWG